MMSLPLWNLVFVGTAANGDIRVGCAASSGQKCLKSLFRGSCGAASRLQLTQKRTICASRCDFVGRGETDDVTLPSVAGLTGRKRGRGRGSASALVLYPT